MAFLLENAAVETKTYVVVKPLQYRERLYKKSCSVEACKSWQQRGNLKLFIAIQKSNLIYFDIKVLHIICILACNIHLSSLNIVFRLLSWL